MNTETIVFTAIIAAILFSFGCLSCKVFISQLGSDKPSATIWAAVTLPISSVLLALSFWLAFCAVNGAIQP